MHDKSEPLTHKAKTRLHILAVSGSTRTASTNTALLRKISSLAPPGCTVKLYEGLGSLPVFSPDLEGQQTPAQVAEFFAELERADALLIASPEYIRSIPGGLKNAIDWLVSRDEIIGKPIVLAHASYRGDDMLSSLRQVLATVSTGFDESVFLRINLMGRSVDEIMMLLDLPENERAIDDFLSAFIRHVQMLNS